MKIDCAEARDELDRRSKDLDFLRWETAGRESDRYRNGEDAARGFGSAGNGASRARFRFIGIRLLVGYRRGRDESHECGDGADDGPD
jgi:hypothetical protein